jgi:tetratricopeptide (TPR) repeat protein
MAESKQNREVGNFQVIWIDPSFIYFDTTLNAKIRCHSITPDLVTFYNAKQCWEYILNTEIDYFFVIITDESLICEASSLVQITFLYLLTPSPSSLISNVKVRGIFENENELLRKVADDVKLCFNKTTKFTLFEVDKSSRDLSRESIRFVWFQHLLEILLSVPESDVAKQEMITFCRTWYSDNDLELAKICEFEKDYCSRDAIKWYTRDSFLYRLLNQVLRWGDIDQMYVFQFILSDLNTQLIELHANYLETLIGLDLIPYTLNVYRGQLMSIQELDRLRRNVLGFISMNTFLSTSNNRHVALMFSGLGEQQPHLESVLFEISIETSTCNSAFAEIGALSWMSSHEDEILLTFGAIFQIRSVHEDENDVWIVGLVLCNRDIKEIPHLQDLFPESPIWNRPTSLSTLAWCLGEMGDSKRAKDIYKNFTQESSTATFDCWNNLAVSSSEHQGITNMVETMTHYQEALKNTSENNTNSRIDILLNMTVSFLSQGFIEKARNSLEQSRPLLIHDDNTSKQEVNMILLARYYMITGNLNVQLDQYSEAQSYFQQAQKIFSGRLSKENKNCGHIETYLGEIEFMLTNYQQAIVHYGNALAIYSKCYPSGHHRIADCHHLIGSAYFHNGQTIEAQQSLELALRLRLQCKSVHPENLAKSYYCLGQLFNRNENHQLAIMYFLKTLDIYQSCLPEDHAKYAVLFTDMGLTYGNAGDFKLGCDYLNRALQIELNRNTSSNRLGQVYLKMGIIHIKNGNFKEGLQFLEQALTILEQNRPSSDEILASALNEMGYTYQMLGDHKMALIKYRAAYDIAQTQELTAIISGNIGALLIELEDHNQAIIYLKKELELRREYLSDQSVSLICCYANLGNVYCKLKDHSTAFTYLAQALRNTPKGPDVEMTANIFNAIGGVWFNQGAYKDALSSYQTALDISTNCLPDNHLTLAFRLNNLATTYNYMEEPDNAVPLYEKALEIYEHNLSSTDLRIAHCTDNIICAYMQLKNYDAVEKYLKKRLDISQSVDSEINSTSAMIHHIFGDMRNVQGRYYEALDYFDKVEAFHLGHQDLNLLIAILKKGSVHYNLAQYDMALQYYERALVLALKFQGQSSNRKLIEKIRYGLDRIIDHIFTFPS